MNQILIIDDDEELCELVSEYLGVEGFKVESVNDGESGLKKALSDNFNLLILDVMLPKMNGFDVLRNLRETTKIPVLMLTARGDDMERIVGLEIGADDYLSKPFNPRELVARIRAILRRTQLEKIEPNESEPDIYSLEDIEIFISGRLVKKSSEAIQLTAVEFDLLLSLVKAAGKVVNKEDLSLEVLERKLSPFDRSLDMHISNLRKKLGNHINGNERIKTIRSVGYIYTKN